jgi:hypothetical protein
MDVFFVFLGAGGPYKWRSRGGKSDGVVAAQTAVVVVLVVSVVSVVFVVVVLICADEAVLALCAAWRAPSKSLHILYQPGRQWLQMSPVGRRRWVSRGVSC